MISQSVIWTTLPNGLSGPPANRRLRLSVFVSPRLRTDQQPSTLALFPDFLDWPAQLQAGRVTFSVQVPSSPGMAPIGASVVSPPPDSSLWTALFSASTPVESHAFNDLRGRAFSSYPIAALHGHLKQSHKQLAQSLVQLPTRQTLMATFPGLVEAMRPSLAAVASPVAGPGSETNPVVLRQNLTSLTQELFRVGTDSVDLTQRLAVTIAHARQLAQISPDTPVPVIQANGSPADPFKQLVAFHRGPATNVTSRLSGPPPAFDFHKGLTFLADYPQLLRLLGLVVDLELAEGSIPQSPSSQPTGRLQVVPIFTQPLTGQSQSPATAYILEGDGFFEPAPMTPAQPEFQHGLLNLQLGGTFEAVQVDVDGGGLKVVNMMATEAHRLQANAVAPSGAAAGAGAADATDTIGVPTLRTSGVTIARAGHGERLTSRFSIAATNNAQIETGQVPTLFADDVIRGYHFDVLDVQAGAWRSLHRRVGTVTFKAHAGGPLSLTITDEGVLQPAVTQPPGADGVNPDPNAELYVHESILHWQGWSLAAPRPGKTITSSGPGTVTSRAPDGGLQLETSFQAEPGTLPRLRFGRRYQFRARTVDLAGNSLSIEEATALLDVLRLLNQPRPILPGEQVQFAYQRFEPVVSPVLVPRERFGEGESLERLVIRSRTGVSASDYARSLTQEVLAARPGSGAHYRPTSERHLAPPKTSQWMVETHGLLDASFGTQTAFQQTYAVARKEKGRLTDTSIFDANSGQAVPIPDTTDVDPATGATISRPSVEMVVTGTGSTGDNGFVLHHEAQLRLPYLPDPFSRAAAMFGVPGLPDASGHQAGVLDADGKLTLVTSSLPPEALQQLGGSSLHIDFGSDWPERVPFRLVLAEPDPPATTLPPTWDAQQRVLTVFLAKAEQATLRLSSTLTLDDLEHLGLWQWLIDMEQNADAGRLQTALEGGHWRLTPFRRVSLVHAVEQPLVAPQLQSLVTPREEHTSFAYLGANVPVHGKSTAKLDIQASWSEPVDDPAEPQPGRLFASAHVFEVPIHLPGESADQATQETDAMPIATYDAQSDVVTLQAPTDPLSLEVTFLSRHEFGDTKHRSVQYQAVATTRFREYFPPEVTHDTARITLAGAAVQVDVPSSARPDAPAVVSVLPTFAWSRTVNPDGTHLSTRTGGLRVYLKRPWFSSGDGELLGVVLMDALHYPPSEAFAPFVTQWGRDPIWGAPDVANPPLLRNFTRATATASTLVLEEMSAVAAKLSGGEDRVLVAGHEVQFDSTRRLWYCDVAVDPAALSTYFPFVRLALARYQPKSLPGLELSRVVLADQVQVSPPRSVRVSSDPSDRNAFGVQVDGISYASNAWRPGDTRGEFEADNPAPDLVLVSIEQRVPGTTDDVGWTPASVPGASIAINGAAKAGTEVQPSAPLWTGKATLPAGWSTGQFRIVIREFEHLLSDDSLVKQKTVGGGEFPVIENREFFPGVGRVVFAETVEL